jgi:trehalose synthase
MRQLDDYRKIVGKSLIAKIRDVAARVADKHVLHVNSTYAGGGVAEILNSLVPLMNDVGVQAGWRILHGNPDFFTITKKFHNGLQGEKINLSRIKKRLYLQANEDFSTYTHIDHDCVIIHDPQPLPLIRFYQKRQPWVWRCHVDISNPHTEVWEFLKGYIIDYDLMIVSNKEYLRDDLPVRQKIIYPVINPLAPKNIPLTDAVIAKYLRKASIPTDKPIITQISRFDKWKDPEGVVKIYKFVRQHVDCRLVLCGSVARDDPESSVIYERVKRKANRLIDTGDVILITSENNILVNALQRFSSVVIQKSIREGFGLTVTEALWKGTPVVASDVGGISLQIGSENGFLHDPFDTEGFARTVVDILRNPELAIKAGENGRETVKGKFLITRLLLDYLQMLAELDYCPAL